MPAERMGPLTILATLLIALAACGSAWAASPGRPNIVLLLADDWGFSDVGAFGGEIATPHLDELAHRGMRFSNFHVSASCSPTRAMLLTGVDNHLNGVGNMRETIPRAHVGKPGYLSVLNTRVVTVATLLRDSGYRTYATGKWHIGKEPHNLPDQRGFERSIVQGDSGSDNWETAKRYLDLTERVDWFEDGKPAAMPTAAATSSPSLCGRTSAGSTTTAATSAAPASLRRCTDSTSSAMKVSAIEKSSDQPAGIAAPSSTPASVDSCQPAHSVKPVPSRKPCRCAVAGPSRRRGKAAAKASSVSR